MEFSNNGRIIMLDYNETENIDLFIKRGNFIIKNIDKFNNYDELIKISFIYIYYKYLNCIYDKELLNKLILYVE